MAGVFAFFRLIKAGYVFAHEGVLSGVDRDQVPTAAKLPLKLAGYLQRRGVSEDRAARISDAMARLGPSYIKLGQFLATRPDLVGRSIATDLEKLHDNLEPFSMDAAQAAIETAFGRPTAAIYKSIDPPMAAASIAQVHQAVVEDETGAHKVAVKILRPGVRKRFEHDLESFYLAARLAERFSPPARRLRPVAVVDTLAHSVMFEMDLRLEAAAISEMAENTADDPGFRLPVIDWERTSRDILTTEWIDGVKVSNVEEIERMGVDPVALSKICIQSFLRHAVRDGFFHADMHPGNLFADQDGNLCAVDLGIMGRLNAKEQRFLAEILYGFITRNYRRVAEVHFEAGYVPDDQDVDAFAQALRAIGEPLQGRTADQISMGRLLTQLFDVTEIFNMHTQPRLILLQKTMVVVEGVARLLDPHLDMWRTSEPVLRDWIASNLGPGGKISDTVHGVAALGRLVTEAPDFVDRMDRIGRGLSEMARDGVRLERETAAEIARQESKSGRWRTAALWVGAISLAVIAFQLAG